MRVWAPAEEKAQRAEAVLKAFQVAMCGGHAREVPARMKELVRAMPPVLKYFEEAARASEVGCALVRRHPWLLLSCSARRWPGSIATS